MTPCFVWFSVDTRRKDPLFECFFKGSEKERPESWMCFQVTPKGTSPNVSSRETICFQRHQKDSVFQGTSRKHPCIGCIFKGVNLAECGGGFSSGANAEVHETCYVVLFFSFPGFLRFLG